MSKNNGHRDELLEGIAKDALAEAVKQVGFKPDRSEIFIADKGGEKYVVWATTINGIEMMDSVKVPESFETLKGRLIAIYSYHLIDKSRPDVQFREEARHVFISQYNNSGPSLAAATIGHSFDTVFHNWGVLFDRLDRIEDALEKLMGDKDVEVDSQ